MYLPTHEPPPRLWPSSLFPPEMDEATAVLRRRLTARIGPDGAVADPCLSRALESGLALRLLDRTGFAQARRPRLVSFLGFRLDDPDPVERALAGYALHGGPQPDDREVLQFLLHAPQFTSARKRAFLDAILAVFGTPPSACPPPEAFSLTGLHAWAAVQVAAVKVILADARGDYGSVSDADVRALLDTQHPVHVWEGHLLLHLLVLHALARLPGSVPVLRVGVEKAMAHQRPDGGLPFVQDEDIWCSVTAGVALAAAGAPAADLLRIGSFLAAEQQPAGGWAYRRMVRQTDVDTTAVALEFLQALGEPRHRPAIRRGIRSLYSVRSDEGGFPTYVPGGPPEACMTAAAVNALGPRLPEHEPAVTAGLDFLAGRQNPDGSFPPDWSRSRFHGVFRALLATRQHPHYRPLRVREMVERSVRLVKTTQNADGGWGQQEGRPSDPRSTSYAVIGVCGQQDPTPVVAGVGYLLGAQGADGHLPSVPDSIGPRPFVFNVPILSDIFGLLALSHVASRLRPRSGDRIGARHPASGTRW